MKEREIDNGLHAISGRTKRLILCLALIAMIAAVAMSGIVFALEDTLWSTVTSSIVKWVGRLGGVVLFVGGIMFGLGWKNDDAEGKSRGITTMIAGGIVLALSILAPQFFA